MLARLFITACMKMLQDGIQRCEAILTNANRINAGSNMDLPWLVSILYTLYQQLATTVEQLRRFYQFFSTGRWSCLEDLYNIHVIGLTARNVYITPLLYAEPTVQFEEFELLENPNGKM